MAGLLPSHYFSSAQRLIQTTLERFWIPIQTNLCCRRWRPAKIRGHSVSSALPCISFHNRAEGTAGTFQRGKSPNRASSGNVFLYSSTANSLHTSQKTGSTQQAWMYSRNQTTIARARKHRQPVFLHPTVGRFSDVRKMPEALGAGPRRTALADSASSLYTTGFPIHLMVRPA
jgi:hypothetical protein